MYCKGDDGVLTITFEPCQQSIVASPLGWPCTQKSKGDDGTLTITFHILPPPFTYQPSPRQVTFSLQGPTQG